MNRREALRVGAGLAALVTLSGCSGGSDRPSGDGSDDGSPAAGSGAGTATATAVPPGRRSTPPATPASTSTPAPGVDYAARFRAFLESESIAVRELREEGPIVTLRYATGSTSYDAVSRDIGRVSGGFFRQVREGWDATRLEATVTDPAGTPLATWYARVEWFREFRDGTITADELSLKVLRTVERTDAVGSGTAAADAPLAVTERG